jgi:CRISPR-associated protein Cas2
MPMTVLVVRDVADRYRGFLASIMPEVAPGVYVSPDLTRGVRERVWLVLSGWWDNVPGGSILLTWRDDTCAGRLGMLTLGLPVRELVELDGALLVRRGKSTVL